MRKKWEAERAVVPDLTTATASGSNSDPVENPADLKTIFDKITIEQGEVTAMGKPLFKIADIEKMILRVYVTSDQLAKLKINQKVQVFAEFGENENREYQGTVTWISDKSEFTPKTVQTQDERANLVYAVKVAVENDDYLKIGMYGGIKFIKE